MLDSLLTDVEACADSATDEVLRRLLERLSCKVCKRCKARIEYALAATHLSHAKRHSCDKTEYYYFCAEALMLEKREIFHSLICVCGKEQLLEEAKQRRRAQNRIGKKKKKQRVCKFADFHGYQNPGD